MHSLSSCYALLTALVLFNSVDGVAQKFFTKNGVTLHVYVRGHGKKIFQGDPLVDFSKSFSRDGVPKW